MAAPRDLQVGCALRFSRSTSRRCSTLLLLFHRWALRLPSPSPSSSTERDAFKNGVEDRLRFLSKTNENARTAAASATRHPIAQPYSRGTPYNKKSNPHTPTLFKKKHPSTQCPSYLPHLRPRRNPSRKPQLRQRLPLALLHRRDKLGLGPDKKGRRAKRARNRPRRRTTRPRELGPCWAASILY